MPISKEQFSVIFYYIVDNSARPAVTQLVVPVSTAEKRIKLLLAREGAVSYNEAEAIEHILDCPVKGQYKVGNPVKKSSVESDPIYKVFFVLYGSKIDQNMIVEKVVALRRLHAGKFFASHDFEEYYKKIMSSQAPVLFGEILFMLHQRKIDNEENIRCLENIINHCNVELLLQFDLACRSLYSSPLFTDNNVSNIFLRLQGVSEDRIAICPAINTLGQAKILTQETLDLIMKSSEPDGLAKALCRMKRLKILNKKSKRAITKLENQHYIEQINTLSDWDVKNLIRDLTDERIQKARRHQTLMNVLTNEELDQSQKRDQLYALLQNPEYLAEINAETDERTLLQYAVSMHYWDIIKMLLSFHQTKVDWVMMLHSAAEGGDNELLGFLLDQGAEVNKTQGDWLTPLGTAACRGHLETVKFLAGKGAHLDVFNSRGESPITMAAADESRREVVKYLLEQGVNAETAIRTLEEKHPYFPDEFKTSIAETIREVREEVARERRGQEVAAVVVESQADQEMQEVAGGSQVAVHSSVAEVLKCFEEERSTREAELQYYQRWAEDRLRRTKQSLEALTAEEDRLVELATFIGPVCREDRWLYATVDTAPKSTELPPISLSMFPAVPTGGLPACKDEQSLARRREVGLLLPVALLE